MCDGVKHTQVLLVKRIKNESDRLAVIESVTGQSRLDVTYPSASVTESIKQVVSRKEKELFARLRSVLQRERVVQVSNVCVTFRWVAF